MRKKSHMALSVYLAAELQSEELYRYRKAFYLGSILPDLSPKMLTEPHEFDVTWDKIRHLITRIVSDAKEDGCDGRTVWLHVGMVLHYLADYFTYPHNAGFDGNLKDHCVYESEMKYLMRAYLCTSEAWEGFETQRIYAQKIHTTQQLFSYIEQVHRDYTRLTCHSVMDDCRQITELCSCVGIVLTRMICGEETGETWLRSCIA